MEYYHSITGGEACFVCLVFPRANMLCNIQAENFTFRFCGLYYYRFSGQHYLKGNPHNHSTHIWCFTGCPHGHICMSIKGDITHNSTLNTILFISICKHCSLRFRTNQWNTFLIPFFLWFFCFWIGFFPSLAHFPKTCKNPQMFLFWRFSHNRVLGASEWRAAPCAKCFWVRCSWITGPNPRQACFDEASGGEYRRPGQHLNMLRWVTLCEDRQ